MLFRQGALVVLAGVLPLAAAGMLTPATRRWFPRVTGWMLALIFYKPAAAAVYATAFTMIGTGKDPRTVLMGFAMVFLSLLALPVLMRFFTWTTGHVADASGGGGFLQTALPGSGGGRRAARDVRRGGRLRPGRAGPHGQRPARPRRFRPVRGVVVRRRSPARHPARCRAGHAARRPPQRPPPPGQARLPAPQRPARHRVRRAASAAAGPRHRRRRARGRRGQRTAQGNRGHAAARHPRRRASELPRHGRAPGLRRVAPPPRHRDVRVRRRGHRRRARRPARPDHHGHRRRCRPAVRGAPGPAGRRARPGQDRRGAAGPGRAAADPLAVRLGAELDPVPGRGGRRAFPRVPDARRAGAADAARLRGRVRRAVRHRAGPPHRADDRHAAGDPRLHLAGQPRTTPTRGSRTGAAGWHHSATCPWCGT